MNKMLLVFIVLVFAVSVNAQLITSENFNYTDNSFLTSNGWVAHSVPGTAPIAVGTSNGLSYAGYVGSGIGNAALLVNTGEDDSKIFTEITSGVIYYSFLVNVTTGTSGYFIHLGANATTFAAKVWVKPSAISGKINFGLSNGTTASYASTPTDFSPGTVYLIIVKYDVTATNACSLWVITTGVPADEASAGSAEITATGSGSAKIDRICLRQYSATQSMVVDGIRVATAWTQAPLPVELTSFTALANPKGAGGHGVELAWKTATEVNNAGFEIEKAVVSNKQSAASWTKIGYVEGHGTTNAPQSYSYNDASAAGTISYRLKQIDRDGKFEYSNTVEVKVGLKAEDFKLTQNYPNPFNPNTTITFAMKTAEQVNVTVYNALGQSVATLFNGIANPNELYSLNFDGKNLSSGTYFYALRSASRNEVRKMLLTK